MELLRGPARVEKLRALLGQWPYAGADAEDDTAMAIDASQRAVAGRPGSGSEPPARRRYTLSELQDVIAASDTELRDALNAIEAFELDGTPWGFRRSARRPRRALTARPGGGGARFARLRLLAPAGPRLLERGP